MKDTKQKLEALRGAIWSKKADGFLVPMNDEYLGEYVPASAQRLPWLTDFTGSAGLAVVLADEAALFVDGRYTLQARQEVDASLFSQFNTADTKPDQWVAEKLPEESVLGYDPWLHSYNEVQRFERALARKHIRLEPLTPNPIDDLWEGRPEAPASEVLVHPVEYSGETHEAKRTRVAEELQKAGADVAVLAATDSVNWLFNIRGRDLAYSPVALAHGLIHSNGRASLYVDSSRVSAMATAQLVPGVEMRPPIRLEDDLFELGIQKKKVLVDAALTPMWFVLQLQKAGAEIVFADDPCQRMKAVKNKVELEGIRNAHLRDGLALTRFLCWLDREACKRDVTEREASAKLLEFRKEAPELISPSFETIAGSGPNGAIVHYRVSQSSNRVIHQNDLFLLDSGGQYPDGTTDVTRTLAISEPTAEHRERFTLVLKGHIAIACARFPEGTAGSQIDVLARAALWAKGFDYDHGTGHGVGFCLNVHEGPQRISKRGGDKPLEAGMIVSNEPGYYREGRYGIRIENLVEVKKLGKMENGKAMLGFATLTCAPLDLRLVDASLLTEQEKEWLNDYHAWVWESLSPSCDADERLWLKQATRSIA